MTLEYILTAVTGVLAFAANFIIILLMSRMNRLDRELRDVKREVLEIRLNYLNRFEDVKTHVSGLHLQLNEKLIILETLLQGNLTTRRRKINGR